MRRQVDRRREEVNGRVGREWNEYLPLRRQHPLSLKKVVYTRDCENTSILLNDTNKHTQTIIIHLFYPLFFSSPRQPPPPSSWVFYISSLKLKSSAGRKQTLFVTQSVLSPWTDSEKKDNRGWECGEVCVQLVPPCNDGRRLSQLGREPVGHDHYTTYKSQPLGLTLTHTHTQTNTHTHTHTHTHTRPRSALILRVFTNTTAFRHVIIWQHDSRLCFPSSHIFTIHKNEDVMCGPPVRLWTSERINYYYLRLG